MILWPLSVEKSASWRQVIGAWLGRSSALARALSGSGYGDAGLKSWISEFNRGLSSESRFAALGPACLSYRATVPTVEARAAMPLGLIGA